MILSLHIENIAVVKSLDIDMRHGFTVLSGETGAGKSIIIDSLNLLCGGRADKDMIRSGERCAEVSAVFAEINKRAEKIISELGFSLDDGMLMISRSVSLDSPSQARLNGRLITLSVLRDVTAALFNIHGQNDNQRLLDKANHLALLDSFAYCEDEVEEYSKIYKDILHTRCEIDSFKRDILESNRMRDMLRYQIEDIDSVKLKSGEEEALTSESKRLQSLEKIKKHCSLVQKAICGGEKNVGAIYMLDKAAAALSQLTDAIPEAEALCEKITDMRYQLDDIADEAAGFCDDTYDDPIARIDKIEGRLEAISKLKRKYGSTVEEILAFREDAANKLDMIENSDERIGELEKQLASISKEAETAALVIREKRTAAAKLLTEKVSETLAFLDMPKVRFEVVLSETEDFSARGLDSAEFMISTNIGEPMMPMIKIASGGELARIMLSLKSILNECDGIDTAIFDEIDTGISGKTSRKVGLKLREISESTQVICVTHSAQIASLAATHLFVSKNEVDGRVETSLRELDEGERVEEIARILGGIEISDIQRRAAAEMINEHNL